MYSPRDMQAEMMVRGYDKGGMTQGPTLEELTAYIRGGGSTYDNAADEVMSRAYGRYEPSAKEYKPSPKERISALGQEFLEKSGMGRQKARRTADTVIGGPSSNLPFNFGLADVATINPGRRDGHGATVRVRDRTLFSQGRTR